VDRSPDDAVPSARERCEGDHLNVPHVSQFYIDHALLAFRFLGLTRPGLGWSAISEHHEEAKRVEVAERAATAERARQEAAGSLRAKRAELVEVLRRRLTAHHRFMLKPPLGLYDSVHAAVAELDGQMEQHLRPFRQAADPLDPRPGVGRIVADVILAEIGPDMERVPRPDTCAAGPAGVHGWMRASERSAARGSANEPRV